MAKFQGEEIKNKTANKTTYFFRDTERKINQLSRDVHDDKEVHYPIGYNGGDKYKSIKKFTYQEFNGKLPIGVYKSAVKGWGFNKTLKPFGILVDSLKIKEVIIIKGGKGSFNKAKKKLFLSDMNLETLQKNLDKAFKKNRDDVKRVLDNTVYRLFPKSFAKPIEIYTVNALAQSLNSWGNSIDEFSNEDKNAIKDLFDKLSLSTDFLSNEALAKTKEIVDSKYLQGTLKKFKKLMQAKNDNEKQWQKLLKENSWIFSSIFAQPVILYQDEAYVGGKHIDNSDGKITDFIIKNSLSDNVSFLEIKTHNTKLLDRYAYRGKDVYSASKELTGSIVQVLNQRDNFQKEYYANFSKTVKVNQQSKSGNFETLNSKCIVLIGSIKDINGNQKSSFELFRNNSKDVEILTFDELQTKVESFQTLLGKK